MKRLKLLLVITRDSPDLGVPLGKAAYQVTENAAAVQEDVRQVMGRTFALEDCLVYVSRRDTPWNLWTFYREMEEQGLIERSLPGRNVLYYMQVWHDQSKPIAITGTQMVTPGRQDAVGRCLDPAGPIEDFLDLPKPPGAHLFNQKSSFKMQARGRWRHEWEHGMNGPYPERIFGNWWDYGMPNSTMPDSAARRAEIALLNQKFLVLT